ncbi:MAG: hypothetical protein ACUVWJ_00245 [Spirochaetota bacterium]
MVPNGLRIMNDTNYRMVRRILKLTCFVALLFAIFFCITWQNIQVYNLNRRLKELSRIRDEVERSIFLKNVELSGLVARERMKKIAVEELRMVPITYRDVKIIVY